ncbi:hypothetical protein OUHCRE10_21380 [Enterobacter hormaechei subsp. xiangfangensis]
MLSVGLIPIFRPRVHYVDIDLNWGRFVTITITGQLFAEFLNLQLPAVDFDLLETLSELAIRQAKPFHYGFEHTLTADSGYLDAVLSDLYAGVSESRDWREFTRISEVRLADTIAVTAWAGRVRLTIMVIAIATNISGLATFPLKRFESFLFELHHIAPLVLVTESPAVTTRAAAILR